MRVLFGTELPGYRPVDAEPDADAWADDHGDLLSAHYFGLPPDLPGALDDEPALRAALARRTAEIGGGLIEASVTSLGGLPALREIRKLPLPWQPNGQVFIGAYTVPRADCSAVVKIQAPERGMTGEREAMVMAQVGHEQFFLPHPYAPDVQGGRPYHVADHAQWDEQFPHHPLTRVRRVLAQLAASVRIAPEFAARPPFQRPGRPARRGWGLGRGSVRRSRRPGRR